MLTDVWLLAKNPNRRVAELHRRVLTSKRDEKQFSAHALTPTSHWGSDAQQSEIREIRFFTVLLSISNRPAYLQKYMLGLCEKFIHLKSSRAQLNNKVIWHSRLKKWNYCWSSVCCETPCLLLFGQEVSCWFIKHSFTKTLRFWTENTEKKSTKMFPRSTPSSHKPTSHFNVTPVLLVTFS